MNKQIIRLMILCLFLWMLSPSSVYAQEFVSQENGLDVTFVVDCSGSMRSNDPEGIGKEMVKAFIDTVHIQDIRVGYVAYSDRILSSVSPVPMNDASKREELKALIDATPYTGDTDIGLGVSSAYSMMPLEEGRDRIIVLISDGETDLRAGSVRTAEQSRAELNQCVEQCRNEEIPIYTIAFGTYEGSTGTLEKIASDTGAANYTVKSPEALIEVLYGIFNNNLSYEIQQFSSGVYAGGNQEIRCVLDERYLDEMDVLLISSGTVGDTILRYGETQIPMTNQSYYSSGKISAEDIDDSVRELTVSTSTVAGQSLKVYLISYRKLTPVLDIETDIPKNQDIAYRVYFKDHDGIIRNEEFYKQFLWELVCVEAQNPQAVQLGEVNIATDGLQGRINMNQSGTYRLHGELSDRLGSYSFDVPLVVSNTLPSGTLPETKTNTLKKDISYNLNDFFRDQDGDILTYSMDRGSTPEAELQVIGDELLIAPDSSGIKAITLFVSDGEDTLAYPFQITVVPLWQAYWWVIVLVCAAAAAVLWKIFYKPKPVLEQITEEKKRNRFCGKLDMYVTGLPEDSEEIPPLSFQLHKVKDNKITLGDLVQEYQEVSDVLGMDEIHLVADEDRRMILYHTSRAMVMIGNSIVCRQIRYHLSFGDVVYITSQDGRYELEIHYVAMIQ